MTEPLSTARLTDYLTDARARTLELVHGLDATQLMGPRLDIVNPLLWEIGHVGWFHEYFALRRLDGGSPRLPNADALYNSSTVPHDVRWELPLPSLQGTLDYMARVQDAMVQRLDRDTATEDRDLAVSADDLPRGHARRGLHLLPSDTRLSRTGVCRGAGWRSGDDRGRAVCQVMSPFPVALCSSARRRRRPSSSTTRNGHTGGGGAVPYRARARDQCRVPDVRHRGRLSASRVLE